MINQALVDALRNPAQNTGFGIQPVMQDQLSGGPLAMQGADKLMQNGPLAFQALDKIGQDGPLAFQALQKIGQDGPLAFQLFNKLHGG